MINAERCRTYGSPRKPGAMKRYPGRRQYECKGQGQKRCHCHIRFVEQRMRDIFVGVQYSAGIKTPIFDSSQFKDLDLDLQAWPNRER